MPSDRYLLEIFERARQIGGELNGLRAVWDVAQLEILDPRSPHHHPKLVHLPVPDRCQRAQLIATHHGGHP